MSLVRRPPRSSKTSVVRPGFYLASDVARDDVPENVRADPRVREPSWQASGGTRRGQLNSFDGYETKYFEATYQLDGTRYAMKCKATRAERADSSVHGPVVIQVYNCLRRVPRTVNGTGHTGPSEFCATSI